MDSDASEPPPRTGAPNPLPPDSAERSGETGEEPYRSTSLFHTVAPLLGVLLGLGTLTLPLASVITDRDPIDLKSAAAAGSPQSPGPGRPVPDR